MSINSQQAELARLRNRHVAKLLDYLGGATVPPYLEVAIKKGFSMFAEDVGKNIINNSDNSEGENVTLSKN